MPREIKIYDTTLRDGTQGEGVSFSMEDKVRIAQRLDALGIHYIEGGWPGSNPKDLRFFKRVQDAVFKTAKISAFGSTRRPGVRPQEDANIQALVEAGPPVVTIFGKAWDFHVTSALGTTLEENLAMIGDSVAYLLKHFEEVIFDAEHFFDGFKRNPEYALRTLLAAEAAGAHCIVLCDTNGGGLPHEIAATVREVRALLKAETPLGIHTHNDSECGVANALAGGPRGRRARAGDDQRLRRALRQRQPGLDHPEPDAEDAPRLPPRARACATCATCPASSRSSPTGSPGRRSPTWATPPSPTRAASTCRRCSSTRRRTSTSIPSSSATTGASSCPSSPASRTSSGRRASTGSTSRRTRPTPAGSSRC